MLTQEQLAAVNNAAESVNMQVAVASTAVLPEAGKCPATLVGYIETGLQQGEYMGAPKEFQEVILLFELAGKNKPREYEGKLYPHVVQLDLTYSLAQRSNFYKLFNMMRGGRADCTHMAQLLGEAFFVNVTHKTARNSDRKYVTLKNESGLNIIPATKFDDETGEETPMVLPKPVSDIKLFLWEFATENMWDSLFIDGEWEAKDDGKGGTIPAKSKNKFQNRIKEALNFSGSAIEDFATGAAGIEEAATTGKPKKATKKPKATEYTAEDILNDPALADI